MANKVVPAGKRAVSQSQGSRQGPSNKNLNSSSRSRANEASTIRGLAGKSIKGPDKGAGGSR